MKGSIVHPIVIVAYIIGMFIIIGSVTHAVVYFIKDLVSDRKKAKQNQK